MYTHGWEIIVNEDMTIYAAYSVLEQVTGKPILYFYPTEETEISVKLLNDDRITTSYPKYTKEGWKVLA